MICGDTAADTAVPVAGRSSRALAEPAASRFATMAAGLTELSVATFRAGVGWDADDGGNDLVSFG